jgi:predicted phage terminase large subunit-like protein
VPAIIGIDVDVDKERRVKIVTPSFEGGNVHGPGLALPDGSDYDKALTPAWVQECVEEWIAFPMAKHDDRVDAMTQAVRRLLKTGVVDAGTSSVSAGGPLPKRDF